MDGTIDFHETVELEKMLTRVRRQALPFATRQTQTDLAFASRKEWQDLMGNRMKLRSKYTANSVRVSKATGLNIATQAARVGSAVGYLNRQEDGATVNKTRKHGVPIPAAAPGRRRLRGKTPSANKFQAVKVQARTGGGKRGVRLQALMRIAAKGTGFAFLNLGKTKGIFRIKQGARKLIVRKVWDLTKRSVTIKPNPTMEPAVERVMRLQRERIWRKNLIYQLRRHRAFGAFSL